MKTSLMLISITIDRKKSLDGEDICYESQTGSQLTHSRGGRTRTPKRSKSWVEGKVSQKSYKTVFW